MVGGGRVLGGRAVRSAGLRGLGLGVAGAVVCVWALAVGVAPALATTKSFTKHGCSTWRVPARVSSVAIEATGSAGGAAPGDSAALGGSGDVVSGALSGLGSGQVLDVCVDHGGGVAGAGSQAADDGGAGGGASGVAMGSGFSAPALIAAGGGGGAIFNGGGGGAGLPDGGAGAPNPPPCSTACGGGGGTQSTFGAGGAAGPCTATCGAGAKGVRFTAAGPGRGGAGGVSPPGGGGGGYGGGGGGGGYYSGGGGGAGGGSAGGGGAGSDFCASTLAAPLSLSGCGPTGTNSTFGTASVVLTYTQPAYQPDAQIKLASDTDYLGVGIVNSTGAGQTRTTTAARGQSTTFDLRFVNAGTHSDAIAVKGCKSSSGFTVKYFKGKTNVTTKVTAGTYKTGKLAAGASQVLQLQIAVSSKATAGKIDTCAVTASSNHAPTRKDVVKAKVRVG